MSRKIQLDLSGDRIALAMRSQGLTQVALAEKAGIPVLVTDLNSWQVASMLFEAGLR